MGRIPCISPGLFHAWPGCLWQLLRHCVSTGAACTKPQVFLRHLQITSWRKRILSSDFYILQLFLSVRAGVKRPVWDCLNKLAQISRWASLLHGLWVQDAGSGRKWCDSAGQGIQKTRSPWLSALVLTWLTVTITPQCCIVTVLWQKGQNNGGNNMMEENASPLSFFFALRMYKKALEIPELSKSKLCGNNWAMLGFWL